MIDAEDPQTDTEYNYDQMMSRDERRFRAADTNRDMIADKQEFTAFLHPEDYEHMRDVVVQVSDVIMRRRSSGHSSHVFAHDRKPSRTSTRMEMDSLTYRNTLVRSCSSQRSEVTSCYSVGAELQLNCSDAVPSSLSR